MRERLQKIIARAGITSRRKAEELIVNGAVTVNGRIIRTLGFQADSRADHIKVNGKLIRPEPLEYYAVNKPRSVLCSVSDPAGRPVVTDLVQSPRRLYPAGRLDFDSEGLVILTNDGELTRAVTRGGGIEKKYRVKVHGKPSPEKLDRMRGGMNVGRVSYSPCEICIVKADSNCWFDVALREGRNRQIRRMFEAIGHPVMRLRRTAIGPVLLGKLPLRAWRVLTPSEVSALKRSGSAGRNTPKGKSQAKRTARRSRKPEPG